MKPAAIYPGTFDPVTLGHLDVITRAAQIFDRVIVAVAKGTKKRTWFSHQERVRLMKASTRGLRGVEVVPFDGLLMEFAHKSGVHVVVRGLRAFSDFEYEFQMALTNRKMAPDVETLFLMTSEAHSYVSSTTVREIAELGGDTSMFVPAVVQRALNRHRRRQ
jgi:pantetheine-phosphate adenylyltransferase